MKFCKLYIKLYRLIFWRKIVFSQSDELGLAEVRELVFRQTGTDDDLKLPD